MHLSLWEDGKLANDRKWIKVLSCTLLVGRVQSSEAIVLDPVKLGLGDGLLVGWGDAPDLLQERHQVPLAMASVGIPHSLHCQLLHHTTL